jgi:FxLD family lantipeptide
MAVQVDTAVAPQTSELDAFDLDVHFAESGPALDVLVQLTGDNCGNTCESACTSCP